MATNFSAKYPPKLGARSKYLQEERERIKLSASLAEKFPNLKLLTGRLAYFGPIGATPLTEIKCTFNVAHSKSVFRFPCPNHECIGGNFDLSVPLAQAVAEHRTKVSGEVRCHGWQSKATVDQVYCDHVLRYKLTLGY